ncbi:hypothetical protein [Paenibacillus lentus]|uniref:Spore coat protein U domain-containing protein n=1 Tax=Paenibacillus lentus TaxID=1338368 RepID=A0A3S8RWF8_9BACL|nr:hypothetical protein [Paenibacillus lentus]AZK47113.1 hypothetical protein EIM92_13890 [Paenibacillus lentus]
MAIAPIVEFTQPNGTSQVNSLDFLTVDAGTVSNDFTILIWNNRGKSSDVSDMEHCTITTQDQNGGNTGELVTGRWIEVRVDSMNENSYTPIGGNNTKTIQAEGAGAGKISGAANNGTVDGAKANYAKVTLQANVPSLATAGNIDFLIRVAYQF